MQAKLNFAISVVRIKASYFKKAIVVLLQGTEMMIAAAGQRTSPNHLWVRAGAAASLDLEKYSRKDKEF